MRKHYRVQSVLLSGKTVGVTLNPVEWVVADPEAGVDDDDVPNGWLDAEPSDEGAEPFEPGGSKTELRFVLDAGESHFLPDEFVTLTIEHTEHTWTP